MRGERARAEGRRVTRERKIRAGKAGKGERETYLSAKSKGEIGDWLRSEPTSTR